MQQLRKNSTKTILINGSRTSVLTRPYYTVVVSALFLFEKASSYIAHCVSS